MLAAALLLAACDRAPDAASTPAFTPKSSAAAFNQPNMPYPDTASPTERARFIAASAAALQSGHADTLIQVSTALRVDAPAVVLALAQAQASSQGAALAAWSRALWQNGQVEPLAHVFAQLALGADLQQDAVQYFSAGPLAGDGTPSYAHATALGYYLGALQAGLQAATAREAERHELVTRLLRSAAQQAGMAEPGPALPPPDASAGARWVRYNLYPALNTVDGVDAEARLLAAALPVTAVAVRPNGEPDLEVAVGSGARSAFLRRQQASRQVLAR